MLSMFLSKNYSAPKIALTSRMPPATAWDILVPGQAMALLKESTGMIKAGRGKIYGH